MIPQNLINMAEALSVKYAQRYNAEKDDLNQEALLGVLEAIKRYKEERGNINTYSYYWIRCYMLRYLAKHRRLIRLPDDIFFNNFKKNGLKQKNCGERKTIRDAEAVIIDRKGENVNIIDIMKGEEDFAEKVMELHFTKKEANKHLSKLDEREKKIVMMKMSDEKVTFADISKVIGVTRQRCDQIYKKALKKMRK